MNYDFTEDWFSRHVPVWEQIVALAAPVRRVLEVGSYEGMSATWLIERTTAEEVYCIDTWEGGREHTDVDMSAVEARFDKNVTEAMRVRSANLIKMKMPSVVGLSKLLAEGGFNSFDFIYLDGGHECHDVLTDFALAYRLCRIGGIIALDDYLFRCDQDESPLLKPKMAIDAVANCLHGRLIPVLNAPLYQIFFMKRA